MTQEITTLFTYEDISRAFDQPGIELTNFAFHYLVDVANSTGESSGLFRCTRLVCAAEKLVRHIHRVAPHNSATIARRDLEFVAKEMVQP